MKKSALIFFLLLVALASCKTQYQSLLMSDDLDGKYKAAMSYFDEGRYNRSAELFESLALATSGTAREDTVRFYWGLSNYRMKDYAAAKTNFKNYIDNFPRSGFAPQAEYYHLDCMFHDTYRYSLDQTDTYKAVAAISEYMLNNPRSPHYSDCRKMLDELNQRLDKKAYENAILYYKMEDYKAAGVALKNILKDNADNIYREDILYYTAMSSYKYASLSVKAKQKERYLAFLDDYFNYIGEYPQGVWREDLDRLYAKVKNM